MAQQRFRPASDDRCGGAGVYKTHHVAGIYSYKVSFNRNTHIRIGLEAGFYQARLDWDQLIFGDQQDPLTGSTDVNGNPFISEENAPASLNNTQFDAGAGLLVYNRKAYGGISLKHLNRPNESFLRINENLQAGRPLRLTVHGGVEIPLASGNKNKGGAFIAPNAMFVKQADTGQFVAGAWIGSGRIFGGSWFRHNFTLPDAAIFAIGVREGVFRIAYSYDFTVSALAAAQVALAIHTRCPSLSTSKTAKHCKRSCAAPVGTTASICFNSLIRLFF
ncbi:MAG: PorP/SprF family type IX secretion system membrane protein [Saprospiraceae bacterium]